MLKTATAGMIALLLAGTSLAYAQTNQTTMGGSGQRVTAEDLQHLTDLRINIVKAALQLTPDQEKYWPAIENAIRTRAKDRLGRLVDEAGRVDQLRGESRVEILRNRDPLGFMNRRADALSQRANDLKKLAAAWQPLYQTLSTDQKRRMGMLMAFVVRDVRSAAEQRRMQSDDDGGQ
jgi:LTXXQ motif family protein